MKKIYIYLLLAVLGLSACNDWLTVKPSDQISGTDLYSTANGYYTQINGIYQDMAKSELYGCELSWGFLDVLAQYYDMDNSSNHGYKNAATYSYGYSRTQAIIDMIWSKMYNIIVNCNDLIQHVPSADTSMFVRRQLEKDVILGEAYALRGFLHFDLLRMFAPATIVDDGKPHIPYVDQFPTLLPLKITNKEFLNKVIADLKRGHELTFAHDSIYANGIKEVSMRFELQTGGYPRFTSHRGYRLNHYAIKGMLARVYQYMGMRDSANYYAQQLVDLNEQEDFFKYNKTQDIEDKQIKNVKLYGDVMFALYNNKLMDYSNILNTDQETEFMCLQDYDGLFAPVDEYDYDTDDRKYQWTNNVSGKMVPLKIRECPESTKAGHFCNTMVPMIRMSEMYYILAENAWKEHAGRARYLLCQVREHRHLFSWPVTAKTQEEMNNQILDDLRRELYGEGQAFYFYKRLNMKVRKYGRNEVTVGDKFVLPIPESNDIN